MTKGAAFVNALEDAARQGTGCLYVSDNGTMRSGRVYFRDGKIYAVTVDGFMPKVGQRLVTGSMLTQEQYETLLSGVSGNPYSATLGQTAVDNGYVAQDVLDAVLREILLSSIGAMFDWPTYSAKFKKNSSTEHFRIPPVSVNSIVKAVRKRRERWSDIWFNVARGLPPATAYPATVREVTTENGPVPSEVLAVTSAANGARNIDEVAGECGLTRFETGHVLAGLVAEGVIVIHETAIEAPAAEPNATGHPEWHDTPEVATSVPVHHDTEAIAAVDLPVPSTNDNQSHARNEETPAVESTNMDPDFSVPHFADMADAGSTSDFLEGDEPSTFGAPEETLPDGMDLATMSVETIAPDAMTESTPDFDIHDEAIPQPEFAQDGADASEQASGLPRFPEPVAPVPAVMAAGEGFPVEGMVPVPPPGVPTFIDAPPVDEGAEGMPGVPLPPLPNFMPSAPVLPVVAPAPLPVAEGPVTYVEPPVSPLTPIEPLAPVDFGPVEPVPAYRAEEDDHTPEPAAGEVDAEQRVEYAPVESLVADAGNQQAVQDEQTATAGIFEPVTVGYGTEVPAPVGFAPVGPFEPVADTFAAEVPAPVGFAPAGPFEPVIDGHGTDAHSAAEYDSSESGDSSVALGDSVDEAHSTEGSFEDPRVAATRQRLLDEINAATTVATAAEAALARAEAEFESEAAAAAQMEETLTRYEQFLAAAEEEKARLRDEAAAVQRETEETDALRVEGENAAPDHDRQVDAANERVHEAHEALRRAQEELRLAEEGLAQTIADRDETANRTQDATLKVADLAERAAALAADISEVEERAESYTSEISDVRDMVASLEQAKEQAAAHRASAEQRLASARKTLASKQERLDQLG